jgi:hypothetical protein
MPDALQQIGTFSSLKLVLLLGQDDCQDEFCGTNCELALGIEVPMFVPLHRVFINLTTGWNSEVMAWSVDRLGRSLQDLVGFVSELHALGKDLFLHQQCLDTTTPSGKAMFQMSGVLPNSSAR